MQILDVAWGKVTAVIVRNYFPKASISKEKQTQALLDAHDSFKDLQDQLGKLVVHAPKFLPEGTTANDTVSVDNSVNSTGLILTNDKILFDVLDKKNVVTEEDTAVDASNEIAYPRSGDARQTCFYCETMLFRDNGECIRKPNTWSYWKRIISQPKINWYTKLF